MKTMKIMNIAIVIIGLLVVSALFFSCAKKDKKGATEMVGTVSAEKLAEANELIANSIGSSAEWTGPTSGPKAATGKSIIYIGSDMTNGGVLAVSEGVKEAAKEVGWKVEVIDGSGSAGDQVSGLNQAIAKKPDGIIIGGWTPNAAKNPLQQAADLGIPIVGWHATSTAGPAPEYNMFFNITTDALDVSRAAALYAIVHSKGTLGVVIFTDSNYQIAIDKANAMRDIINEYGGKVLEYVDTPIADTATRMPTLTSRLLQEYGDQFYSLAINDNYFTGMKSTLKQQGLPPAGPPYNISAGDGDAPAFARIRSVDYQTATVPEPLYMQGWQLIDELNRAMANQEPSGFVPPVFIIAKENIGSKDVYDPDIGYRSEYKKIWK